MIVLKEPRFFEVEIYQVRFELLKCLANESIQDKTLLQFLNQRNLDDKIELNPSYYERTNKLQVPYVINGQLATYYDVLSYLFYELNIGTLRANHKSYSLSINDVIAIDGKFYRVCAMGFKPLTDWTERQPFKALNSPCSTSKPQLSNQTTELRAHQDIEFDVFVFYTDSNELTFLEDYSSGAWCESELDKEPLRFGRLYPKNTNISPFHLHQKGFYLITYIDEHGVHHAYENLTARDVEKWLSVDEHKIAYKDSYASIYVQDKYLSLSAYKAFLELH